MNTVEIKNIKLKLKRHNPHLLKSREGRYAAVGLILREGKAGAEVLFIERAKREGDPWSGQMAFPGGKQEPEDVDLQTTVERETMEEIGLDLSNDQTVGQLDDVVALPASPARGLVISCFLYETTFERTLVTNVEVEDTVWIPIASLLDKNYFLPNYRPSDYRGSFPGIKVSENDVRVIWGLTYRFLCSFFRICELNHP